MSTATQSAALPVSPNPCPNSCKVTIVVVPRERFSCAQESLESIYANTQMPFKLVYVDGNSPAYVRRYLEQQSQVRNFQLVRTHYYLVPNHARNLGLRHVDTEYVVFVDNDVIVAPGWLEALVSCADESGAAVVGPLMCQDRPVHELVHFAGGEAHVVTDVNGKRHLREKMYLHLKQMQDVPQRLHQGPTELVEFHCMLVRTDTFKQVGPFDEGMLSTKEHMDFCMTVAAAGKTIFFEPKSVVTYVPGPPEDLADVHFYMLRWSDDWTRRSLDRLQEKWHITADKYLENTYRRARARRVITLIDPLCQKLSFGGRNQLLNKLLRGAEKYLNKWITFSYAKRHLNEETGKSQPSQNQIVDLETV